MLKIVNFTLYACGVENYRFVHMLSKMIAAWGDENGVFFLFDLVCILWLNIKASIAQTKKVRILKVT